MITSLNEMETEIKIKIAAVNKCYHALGPVLKKEIYIPVS
jgi:hypothetical protein